MALLGGALADRFDRRKVLLLDQIALVLCSGTLAALSFAHVTPLGLLYVLGGLLAGAGAVQNVTRGAIVPNLVDPEDLPTATVLNGATWGTMLAVGAGLGGLAAALIGPHWCFAIDAVSFLLSGLYTWRTTRPFGEDRRHLPRAGVRADLRATKLEWVDDSTLRVTGTDGSTTTVSRADGSWTASGSTPATAPAG